MMSGITVGPGSLIAGCNASDNGTNGITVELGSTVQGCITENNRGAGILARNGTSVLNCSARQNLFDNIRVEGDCLVSGNSCDNSSDLQGSGIYALSGDNRIENNNLTDNRVGLRINGSGNYVANNTVRNNSTNYVIAAGNQLNILLSQLPQFVPWPATIKLAGTLTGVRNTNGITIASDDVTIDLNDHSLVGVAQALDGGRLAPRALGRVGACHLVPEVVALDGLGGQRRQVVGVGDHADWHAAGVDEVDRDPTDAWGKLPHLGPGRVRQPSDVRRVGGPEGRAKVLRAWPAAHDHTRRPGVASPQLELVGGLPDSGEPERLREPFRGREVRLAELEPGKVVDLDDGVPGSSWVLAGARPLFAVQVVVRSVVATHLMLLVCDTDDIVTYEHSLSQEAVEEIVIPDY